MSLFSGRRKRILWDMATDGKNPAGGAARAELDGMVVNLELTLISIIQGVALYFLTDSARGLMFAPQWALLPYVASGLFIIMIWWSRAVIHTLTVIRWPMEFTHNFFYIASTLFEAAMFAHLAIPAEWFAIGAVYMALLWLLFASDLRLIRQRMAEARDAHSQKLLSALYREQRFHATVSMPLAVLFYIVAALTMAWWPDRFAGGANHLIFGIPQLLGSLAYVIYLVRYMRALGPDILAMRAAAPRAG